MHTPVVSNVRAGDPWVCAACQHGCHDRCISRTACECVHVRETWLTPERRAELRAGQLPRTSEETSFQDAFFAHQADRAGADERRG